MIKDFDELLARAGRRETNRDQIDKNADRVGLDLSRIEVINLPSGPEACERAVQLVSSGEGDI